MTAETSTEKAQLVPSMLQIEAQTGTSSGTRMPREARRTLQLAQTLPKGITIGQWSDPRTKPFYVRFGTNRVVESFVHEQDRNDRAARLAEQQEKEGVSSMEFDAREWRAYKAFVLFTGASLAELERLWMERTLRPKEAPLCSDAVEAYIRLRLAEDVKQGTDTFRHIKKHLKERLAGDFGHRKLDDISTEELRAWFGSLKDPETNEPMSKVTVKNHRVDVNTFFKRAVYEDWITRNPCERVKPPKIPKKDRPPMPVKDIFQLLKANRDDAIVGRLALELFGALRCSSAARCQEKWIKWEARAIRMPGVDSETEEQKHKSGKSKYREGHPPVLWEWLKHASPAMWTEINEGNHGHKKSEAFIRARVKNPGNGLRRSCASYQIAVHKSVGPVSWLMQHVHQSTTEIYLGEAGESDGLLFMAMSPDAVLLSWEQFVQLNQPKKQPAP